MFSISSELARETESSSEEVAGGVFFGACFPPLGPFPFSLFHNASGGASSGGSLASMCSGSSLAGFNMDDWVFGKGAVGSACAPWRALMARTFILGSFRGLRLVRGSEIAAALGAASELGTFTHQARGSYTNCAILIF